MMSGSKSGVRLFSSPIKSPSKAAYGGERSPENILPP